MIDAAARVVSATAHQRACVVLPAQAHGRRTERALLYGRAYCIAGTQDPERPSTGLPAQVHDVDGRLDAATFLLEANGFAVHGEPAAEGPAGNWMLYAWQLSPG